MNGGGWHLDAAPGPRCTSSAWRPRRHLVALLPPRRRQRLAHLVGWERRGGEATSTVQASTCERTVAGLPGRDSTCVYPGALMQHDLHETTTRQCLSQHLSRHRPMTTRRRGKAGERQISDCADDDYNAAAATVTACDSGMHGIHEIRRKVREKCLRLTSTLTCAQPWHRRCE